MFRGPRGSIYEETRAESTPAYWSPRKHSDGYGRCLHCGGSWAIKRPHWTWYSDAAMGPLCEECYDELSPEERLPYYVKLWESWGSPEDVDFSLIRQGIGLEEMIYHAKRE